MIARIAQGPTSKLQKQVFREVQAFYPDAIMEYWVHTKDGNKSVDIYIPSRKLVIECDGYYWHKNREDLDKLRQSHIEKLGYRVVRIPEKEWIKDKNIFRYI
jgi:excinuclease UvrABC helicase subunit UvrB